LITDTFIPGKGPLYSFDPRPKLILLLLSVFLFLFESTIALQAGLVVLILSAAAASLGISKAAVPIRSILPILILTALLTPPFNRSGEALLVIGGRTVITDEGLRQTVSLLLRFTGITASFFLFFSTTRISPMILAFRAFGLPYRAALTVTISLRYIPDMFTTYGRITDAHKLRTAGGAERKKGFRHRITGLFPVLTAVLIHAVKEIPTLAMALDSKGFGRSGRRTSCRKLPPWKDIVPQLAAAAAISILLSAASVLI